MDEKWVKAKQEECEAVRPEIEKLVKSLNMSDKDYNDFIDSIESKYSSTGGIIPFLGLKYMSYCGNGEDEDFDSDYENFTKFIKNSKLEDLIAKYKSKDSWEDYLDMSMEFDGDIIITDPCYIMREDDDWATCAYGENMEALGITHYMTRDTLYGDWSCTTFDTDTKEAIGEFCADAGLVSVFLLDEVLKYNPDYDWHITKPFTVTMIKDFKGTVVFAVKHIEGYYEEDTDYWKKGEYWEYYVLEVVGHGINKVTGKPINFVGKQTGI